MTTKVSRAAVIVLGFLASGALGACGSDDSDEPESTTAEEPALDATAFRECILSDSLGYGETDTPEPELAEVAGEAEFFETTKGNEVVVWFYVFDDATAAEDFSGELEATLPDVTERLAEEFFGGDSNTYAVETHGSVVVGIVPFKPSDEGKFSKEVESDVLTCTEEQTGA